MTCTLRRILFGRSNRVETDGWVMQQVRGGQQLCVPGFDGEA